MVPRETAAGHLRPQQVPLASGRPQQVRERDRHIRHAEREFGYRVYLVGYGGEREEGKGEKGRKKERK